MTTASELVGLLEALESPDGEGFRVRTIPSAPGYAIGRGSDGIVALLTPPDPKPDPPTRLRTLTLEPRVRVVVDTHGADRIEEYRGLVELRTPDPDIVLPFLTVAAAVVRMVGQDPQPRAVSSAMMRLVKIFDRTEAARGSVLGLFGELVVIATSLDPGQLVDAWHARIDDKFDFSDEGSRLEVKTTARGVRHHMFDLRQLQPPAGTDVRIASVMTTETNAGTSVSELIGRVEGLLAGNAERQVRLHQQVAATLGPDWLQHLGHRFDELQAAQSLLLFDPTDIPKVASPPVGVISVSLTVDCSEVEVDKNPTGLALLVAPSAVTG